MVHRKLDFPALNGVRLDLGFVVKLLLAADQIGNNMDGAEYRHVVPSFIFGDV